ncbi:uncharacterized protein BO97DRAFT_281787 [Aspergillus homomorphus CBS 101889]|uniref:Uncharacterized protein n=1 Tax=Aspergillus homomorphus (strain CBS 101889) TaxID=1450537 RepID=A0A395I3U1_ASPHC|nr:hypothetical protein BO97DRAFT_281787 [Aspergillus homomorphus CBS 101889]RAL14273.1 hypothetical protein BO97DRAFT_281787 [Aspergillus homomorphus CBS 101889]
MHQAHTPPLSAPSTLLNVNGLPSEHFNQHDPPTLSPSPPSPRRFSTAPQPSPDKSPGNSTPAADSPPHHRSRHDAQRHAHVEIGARFPPAPLQPCIHLHSHPHLRTPQSLYLSQRVIDTNIQIDLPRTRTQTQAHHRPDVDKEEGGYTSQTGPQSRLHCRSRSSTTKPSVSGPRDTIKLALLPRRGWRRGCMGRGLRGGGAG